MTENLQALPAAGAVQDALNPGGQGFPRPLRCGLVAGLPVIADADMKVGGFPVVEAGPAWGSLLIHVPIIGSNKCVDKYLSEVFNVNTINEAIMENITWIAGEKDHWHVGVKHETSYGTTHWKAACNGRTVGGNYGARTTQAKPVPCTTCTRCARIAGRS